MWRRSKHGVFSCVGVLEFHAQPNNHETQNIPQNPGLTTEICVCDVQLDLLRSHSLSYVRPSDPHTGVFGPVQGLGHEQRG